jgi:trehalose 6-phosphate synthase
MPTWRALLLRVVLPVILLAAIATLVATPFIDRLLNEWFLSDLDLRANVIMKSLEEPLPRLLVKERRKQLEAYLGHVSNDERLRAILVCRDDGGTEYSTPQPPPGVQCEAALNAIGERDGTSRTIRTRAGQLQVSSFPIFGAEDESLHVELVQDLGFANRRRSTARSYLLFFVASTSVIVSLIVLAGVRWTVSRWLAALLGDIRGRRFLDDAESSADTRPVLSQVRQALRDIEQSQRAEIEYQENWTPLALQHVVRDYLGGAEMLVVSNREPYVHHRVPDSGGLRVQVPPSGMVTALEPMMRACSGTWVAQGSGDADRDVVDAHDRVQVPPGAPSYTLRRVWLSAREEEGYYYGLANEGLWALCHLAYVRPEFRASDWAMYEAVNAKFAAALVEEARTPNPVVLIQDFHFALLPALLRPRLPKATLVMFWHIPWPNAETFGVCPWKQQLLLGLLQNDILGFHTRYHCQNFLATVDRFIECQIDHERMTVTLRGHTCQVAAYPISIEWPPRYEHDVPDAANCRARVRAHFGIGADVSLGLGVERWDFTKGILERFAALEQALATRPALLGRVTLLQIAAPSRATLPAYRSLQKKTLAEAARINERFASAGWQPIVLVGEHREPIEIFELYRAADFCMVNSLHDGMNLVAKEFVAARDDEDGVLILSTFAGASRELIEALLVNPFDVIETAAAIEAAVAMPREERRERMRLMRDTVKHNNVYRWAGRMLVDAARIRQRQRLGSGASRDPLPQRAMPAAPPAR